MERRTDLFDMAVKEFGRGSAVVGAVADKAYTHLRPVLREFLGREVVGRFLEKIRGFKAKARYGRQMR